MIRPVTKCVKVSVTPTINELADIIWGMDCEEQAMLLQLLACRFDTTDGSMQLLNVSTEVVEHGYPNTVGSFVNKLYEYLGWRTLLEEIKKNRLKKKLRRTV